MNQTQLKRIFIIGGIILVIAVGISFITFLNSQNKIKTNIIDSSIVDEVDKIQIDKSSESKITLNRVNDDWKIGEKLADNDVISKFLSNLKESNITSVASSNTENYEIFLVRDEDYRNVGLYNGDNRVATLIIGKNGTSPNSSYVRVEGDKNVYLVNKPLTDFIIKEEKDFWNKSVTSTSADSVTKLTTNNFTIVKENGNYRVDNNETELNKDKAFELISAASNLKGFQVVEKDVINNQKSTNNFRIELNDGRTFEFSTYLINDKYYVLRPEDSSVVEIYSSEYSKLNQDLNSLK